MLITAKSYKHCLIFMKSKWIEFNGSTHIQLSVDRDEMSAEWKIFKKAHAGEKRHG